MTTPLNMKPAVVIDNGTGYTKMGFAGNSDPSYVEPTLIGTRANQNQNQSGGIGIGAPGSSYVRAANGTGMDDLDFYFGNEAQARQQTYALKYPIKHGIIENWSDMEKIWHRCVFKYLECEPEEHFFLLTEPPMNTPENREFTAEVMFETFNVPGMYIAVQAILSLAASLVSTSGNAIGQSLTGTVIDSGDGVTHVMPVAEGYVIGSCIRSMPVAGRDVTAFVQGMLRDRKEPIPAEDHYHVSKTIKEKFCTVCQDVVKQYEKYDENPEKYFKTFSGTDKSARKWTANIGYERFLGPEIFFRPQIFNPHVSESLPELVDRSILACPIDTRRSLYGNIVLSGGSTMFKNFGKRVQDEVKRRVQVRMTQNAQMHQVLEAAPATEIDVNVVSSAKQRYAVWFGGSMLSSTDQFYSVCHTKAQYDELGPSIARHNPVFNTTL